MMADAQVSIPLSPSLKLMQGEGGCLWIPAVPVQPVGVGSLMYLSVCTRPHIAFGVGALARFMSKPTSVHWQAAKGVLRTWPGLDTVWYHLRDQHR
jgi:hypothetical protein